MHFWSQLAVRITVLLGWDPRVFPPWRLAGMTMGLLDAIHDWQSLQSDPGHNLRATGVRKYPEKRIAADQKRRENEH